MGEHRPYKARVTGSSPVSSTTILYAPVDYNPLLYHHEHPVMSEFILHPRLATDCTLIKPFELSLLLMSNDARYPWFILVPQRQDISEPHQLSESDYALLWHESRQLSLAIEKAFAPDKLNIAAIGNLVPQLHLHHVARFTNDDAWPAPIWGRHDPLPISDELKQSRIETLLRHLTD